VLYCGALPSLASFASILGHDLEKLGIIRVGRGVRSQLMLRLVSGLATSGFFALLRRTKTDSVIELELSLGR
jgi:hypothetical protein